MSLIANIIIILLTLSLLLLFMWWASFLLRRLRWLISKRRFSVCLLHNPHENRESDIGLYLGWNSFIPVIQVIFLRIFSFGMDVSFFLSQLGFVFFFPCSYLFVLAALGLCCRTLGFLYCSEWGSSLVTMCRLLIAVAFLVLEHGL